METRPLRWRTTISGAVYADSTYGSDEFGDGSQEKPYRTLEKAYFGDGWLKEDEPDVRNVKIVCRGYFTSVSDRGGNVNGDFGLTVGSHSGAAIIGDWLGGAVYDGEGKNCLIGFEHRNMIVTNCATPTSATLSCYSNATATVKAVVNTSNWLSGGVGRAISANSANGAPYVFGVSLSTCIVHDTPLLWGCVGSSYIGKTSGPSDNGYIVYSRPRPCGDTLTAPYRPTNRVWLGRTYQCTIFGVGITDRCKQKASASGVTGSLFAGFDMIADEPYMTEYFNCLWASDCAWYFEPVAVRYATFADIPRGTAGTSVTGEYCFVEDTGVIYRYTDTSSNVVQHCTNGRFEFDPSGLEVESLSKWQYSALYENQLLAWREARFAEIGTEPSPLHLNGCLFSRQNSREIMNDPDNLDFTLSANSDAYFHENTIRHAGAMTRAIRIPVYGGGNAGSDQKAACWDNRTAGGKMCVESVEGSEYGVIKYNRNTYSNLTSGSIMSKVLRINRPDVNLVHGLWNLYRDQMSANKFKANRRDVFERSGGSLVRYTERVTGDGLYMASGGTMRVGAGDTAMEVADTYTAWLTTSDSITPVTEGACFLKVVEPNVCDVIYVRAAQTVESAPTGSITDGRVYFNLSGKSINYGGDEIVAGESFTGRDGITEYTSWDGSLLPLDPVVKVFEDTESGWVPASMCGDYFVLKQAGTLQTDNDGEYYSSGNAYAYKKGEEQPKALPEGTSLDGYNGSGTAGDATGLNQPYLQFKLVVTEAFV